VWSGHMLAPLIVLTVAGVCLSWIGVVGYIEQLAIFSGHKDLALFARIWLVLGAVAAVAAEGTVMLLMAFTLGTVEQSRWQAPLGVALMSLGLGTLALYAAYLILIAATWFVLAPPRAAIPAWKRRQKLWSLSQTYR